MTRKKSTLEKPPHHPIFEWFKNAPQCWIMGKYVIFAPKDHTRRMLNVIDTSNSTIINIQTKKRKVHERWYRNSENDKNPHVNDLRGDIHTWSWNTEDKRVITTSGPIHPDTMQYHLQAILLEVHPTPARPIALREYQQAICSTLDAALQSIKNSNHEESYPIVCYDVWKYLQPMLVDYLQRALDDPQDTTAHVWAQMYGLEHTPYLHGDLLQLCTSNPAVLNTLLEMYRTTFNTTIQPLDLEHGASAAP